jgi:asparagine synthase (glutamine-hydrolysing)
MCGINGFIGKDESALGAMNGALRHRGPDFAGAFSDGRVTFGHTLLSIREVAEASKQPYRRAGSPWVLAFNGQLYNTRHLKSLLGPEHQKTDLDTALLYALIEKKGWAFTDDIHGMFAIALYNADQKILRLYRDPTGQKNLYWYWKDGVFAWSSEIRGLMARGGHDRAVDPEAVAMAANLGYVPGPKTLFKHVRKLQIGEELTYRLDGAAPQSRFFESKADGYFPADDDAAFRLLIEEHLQSKQRVAINLSGGLDSSLLVHEMSKLGHEIHTYTTFFEGGDDVFNIDALLARRLAKDYGTDHTEIVVTKDAYLANLVESFGLIEEPNYNISLPAYLITAKREGVMGDKNRVILSGDGGDELFCGYPHYLESRKMDLWSMALTPWLFDLIKNRHGGDRFRLGDPVGRWLFFRRFRKRFLRDDGFDPSAAAREAAAPAFGLYAKGDGVRNMMILDRALWMAAENFIRSDKLYMSQSLELRSPLSYHPFRLHMDKRLKRSDYLGEGANKRFLRRHYLGKLPDYIVKRKDKTGWRSPVQGWYDKRFKETFLATLPASGSLVDWPAVKKWMGSKETWPGKQAHLYLSLAVLSKGYNLDI